MNIKYRIICHDDPSEDILYYSSRDELIDNIQEWFDGLTRDGYATIQEFNKERRGINSAQIKKNGRWSNIPWKKRRK